MISRQLTTREKKEWQDYEELRKKIHAATKVLVDYDESMATKEARKKKLLANPEEFCYYYFPHYMRDGEQLTKLGWFHKKALKTILPDTITVLEWAREHAKSVLADIFLPMLMYSRPGTNDPELQGMVIASATEKKAQKLLRDVQAEIESNALWQWDFGEKVVSGSWLQAEFATNDGIGFWGFGLGQSPRGIREGAKRPNLCIVDDGDTKERCKNEERVQEAVDWIKEDLFGCFGIKSGTRFVIAGNRIDKCSIIAKMVGDIEEGDPINSNINHIKVYALENPRTHEMDLNGTPAWKERFTVADLEKRWKILASERAKLREYFHQHVEEANIFKDEWFIWDKVPSFKKLVAVEIYCDPSFKNNKNSDFKAIITQGKDDDGTIYVLEAWVRQDTVKEMVKEFYRLHGVYGEFAKYRMEANFIQDLLLDEFDDMAKDVGYNINIRGDKRDKPDKFSRIENMSPLYERKKIIYNEAKRKDPDMQRLKSQLTKFPYGKDDAPDAQEGGIHYLQKATRSANFKPRLGKYNRNSNRV
jgi:predicted phage terminase large subunit-like protein